MREEEQLLLLSHLSDGASQCQSGETSTLK
jgi:hypothetical protein